MNYRHSDKYSTHTLYNIIILLLYIYIYTYIDIYNIHIHLITSYTQQLQSDNIIYMFGEWFLFRSIHELWFISAFRGGDHYSSGRFEFVRCRMTLDAAVSAACCDSCRCREIGVLVDGCGWLSQSSFTARHRWLWASPSSLFFTEMSSSRSSNIQTISPQSLRVSSNPQSGERHFVCHAGSEKWECFHALVN